jgi:hypothetical protein
MIDIKNTLVAAFALVVTFLVPTIVWLTVISGLYQLAREEIRKVHVALPHLRRATEKSPS